MVILSVGKSPTPHDPRLWPVLGCGRHHGGDRGGRSPAGVQCRLCGTGPALALVDGLLSPTAADHWRGRASSPLAGHGPPWRPWGSSRATGHGGRIAGAQAGPLWAHRCGWRSGATARCCASDSSRGGSRVAAVDCDHQPPP